MIKVMNPLNVLSCIDLNSSDWEIGLNKFYLTQSNESSIEKKVFQSESNYMNQSELNLFRHNSLIHLLGYQLEKCVSDDIENGSIYANIVFTGGVLNTPGLKQILQNDMKSLMYKGHSNINDKYIKLHFPNDEDDSSIGFYKGANYLAKLNGLRNLMVSRQDYYELGVQGLGYNYI